MEKTFERILNKRIQDIIPYTDAQAGGRPGRSTIDQLFILKAVIKQAKEDGRQLYITFLSIQKAHDKAWLDAILYGMLESVEKMADPMPPE